MASQILPVASRRQNTSTSFYVYVHKTLAGRVFYVGKGHGRRAWSRNSRNSHWRATVQKHGLQVEIVESHLLEWYAFQRETELIDFYGRCNLVNMTDGGDGSSGYTPSEETRAKTSKSSRAAHARLEVKKRHRAATAAAVSTPEARAKMAAAGTGRKQSVDHVANRISAVTSSPAWLASRAAMRGRPLAADHKIAILAALASPVLCVETGVVFETQTAAAEWVRIKNLKACSANISRACSGVIKSAYGYHWRKINDNQA